MKIIINVLIIVSIIGCTVKETKRTETETKKTEDETGKSSWRLYNVKNVLEDGDIPISLFEAFNKISIDIILKDSILIINDSCVIKIKEQKYSYDFHFDGYGGLFGDNIKEFLLNKNINIGEEIVSLNVKTYSNCCQTDEFKFFDYLYRVGIVYTPEYLFLYYKQKYILCFKNSMIDPKDSFYSEISVGDEWSLFDIIHNADASKYVDNRIVDKYKDRPIVLSDSIVILDEVYTYVKQTLDSKSFFGSDSAYQFYTNLFDQRYSINIKDSVDCISLRSSEFTNMFPSQKTMIQQDELLFYREDNLIICYKSSNSRNRAFDHLKESKGTLPFESPISDSYLDLLDIWNEQFFNSNIEYKYLRLDSILSRIACGSPIIRYYRLPNKGTNKIILAPFDCSDNYLIYLVSISERGTLSSLYVDGLFFEHIDMAATDPRAIRTMFKIDEDYNIIVSTRSINSEVIEKYQIQNDGKITKVD